MDDAELAEVALALRDRATFFGVMAPYAGLL
jgi:hypothetical protein